MRARNLAGLTLVVSTLLSWPAIAQRESSVIPPPAPDPTDDPLMMRAGFLNSHPDMLYRLHGLEAFKRKDYEDAFRFFRRSAYHADKPSQGMVAELLWEGKGVPQDRAQAYAWMDLAAERGYAGFLGLRERYWNALTEEERARALREGQTIYARYGDAAAKPRYELQLRRERKRMTGSRTGFTGNLQIIVPGPGGEEIIDGSKFYDPRYWDAKKYWEYTDQVWAKPRIGRVTVGEVENTADPLPIPSSRVPGTKPEIDAPEPEIPNTP